MYFFSRNYILDDFKPELLKFFYCYERKDTQNNFHFVQMHSYFFNIFLICLSLCLSQPKLPVLCNSTKTPVQCSIFYPFWVANLQQEFMNTEKPCL